MGSELKARVTGNSNLRGPGRAIRLGSRAGVIARGRGLKEAGKAGAVLMGSHHGHGTAEGGADGNGPKLTVSSSSIGQVPRLSKCNESTAEEPGTD